MGEGISTQKKFSTFLHLTLTSNFLFFFNFREVGY